MAGPNAVRTSPSGKAAGRLVTSMTLMTSFSVLILLLPFLTPGVSAYSSGAPESVCNSMVPGHVGSRNMYTNPFTIVTSSSTYGPLQLIDVTIEPNMDVQVRGFLVQARPADNRNANLRIGSFVAGPGSRLACNSGALTHSYSADRMSVTVSWRAPPVPQGDIVFRVTVVREYTDYYTELYSNTLSFQMPTTTITPTTTTTTTTTPSPTTTTTTPTTTTTTTPPPSTTTTPPTTTTTTTASEITTKPTATTTTTTTPPTTTTTTPANQPPTGSSASQTIMPTIATDATVNGTSPFLPGNMTVPPGLQIPDAGDDSTSEGVALMPSSGSLLLLTMLSAMLHLLNVKVVTLS